MSRLVGALAFGTIAFAGATLYFANEWRIEEKRAADRSARAVLAAGSAQSPQSPVSSSQHSQAIEARDHGAIPVSTSRPSVTAATSKPRVLSREEEEARMQEALRESSASYLKQYDDPREREQLLERAKAEQQYFVGRFPQIAGLSEQDTELLRTALAQVSMQHQVKVARCRLEPGCSRPLERDLPGGEELREQISAVLGPQVARRYESFRSSLLDRATVTSFRARLDVGQMLSDADTERLVEALADERMQYMKEIEQGGGKARTFNMSGVVFAVQARADTSAGADVDGATQFSERMRSRASKILSPDQLRVFAEVQEDAIYRIRERSGGTFYQAGGAEARK